MHNMSELSCDSLQRSCENIGKIILVGEILNLNKTYETIHNYHKFQ